MVHGFWARVTKWLSRETGQDVVEYSVLVVFVSLIAIAAINLFGQKVLLVWQNMTIALNNVPWPWV
jgi:Flp pilus assembly pilin Flp